jgi:hydrogenase maturation protease
MSEARVVLIGYGNELRNDDGAGQRVARAVADWRLPGVQAVAVHQLTPELVVLLADAARAIFVDASPGEWSGGCELQPAEAGGAMGHVSDPRELLALTQALYGRWPPSVLVTVPAGNLDFGEQLSAVAERGLEEALRQVARLLGVAETVDR